MRPLQNADPSSSPKIAPEDGDLSARRPLRRSRQRLNSRASLERNGEFIAGLDHLGKPDCVQQAGGDAAGEARATAGDERQPRPQRVAGRRVRVVGQRVEKEVGSAMARQMLRQGGGAPSKDQARRINPARRGLSSQVGFDARMRAAQPQDARWNLLGKFTTERKTS
jgi:hypothetical protein